jgi:CBS domain-containing protein
VVLADSVRNYMTKALSDDWMIDNGFADNDIIKAKTFSQHWWDQKKVCELDIKTPLTITNSVTVRDAIALLKREGFDMVPVLSDDGSILGVATEGNMTAKILAGKAGLDDPVSAIMYKKFAKVAMNDTLGSLAGKFGECLVGGGGGAGGGGARQTLKLAQSSYLTPRSQTTRPTRSSSPSRRRSGAPAPPPPSRSCQASSRASTCWTSFRRQRPRSELEGTRGGG